MRQSARYFGNAVQRMPALNPTWMRMFSLHRSRLSPVKQANITNMTILGGQDGDEGKGASVHDLIEYLMKRRGRKINFISDLVQNCYYLEDIMKDLQVILAIRFGGGQNAGHTLVFSNSDGKKVQVKLRIIPSAVIDPKAILYIGPDCVINWDALEEEICRLEALGLQIRQRLIIASEAGVVTQEHIQEDIIREEALAKVGRKIGTTRNGIGPAVAHQAYRDGPRVGDCIEFRKCGIVMSGFKVWDLLKNHEVIAVNEGAQAMGLDPNLGPYPYVTSIKTKPHNIHSTGLPMNLRGNVTYLVAKAYHTYVGNKQFQPDGEIFEAIGKHGMEFGTVTGRKRQVNYLNLDTLIKHIRLAIPPSGHLVMCMRKLDVMVDVAKQKDSEGKLFDRRAFGVIYNNRTKYLDSSSGFQQFVEKTIKQDTGVSNFVWSMSPEANPDAFEGLVPIM